MISYGSLWSYIQIGEKSGYMMTEFLTSVSPSQDPIVPVVGGSCVISANGKNVNLRTGPGKRYKSIRSYAVGTPLTVITRGKEWSFIHIGSKYGYMMNEFIYNAGVNPVATQTDL